MSQTTVESPATWITGAVVLDPDIGSTSRADVLIRADRIAEVVAVDQAGLVDGAVPGSGDPAATDDARRVDGSGCLLIPGLIDCHAHVAFPAAGSLPRSSRILEASSTMRVLLARGITTVRDASGADAGFPHALREGWIEGPDLLVSLRQLGPTGGLGDSWRPDVGRIDWLDDPALPDPVFDGPDAARAAVRRMVRAGADWIKLGAGGAVRQVRAGRDVRPTDAELAAAVEEAGRCGRDVLAHAHTAQAVIAAARAGVRSVEHGFFADEIAVDVMRSCGCWFVPTLAAMGREDSAQAAGHRRVVRAAAAGGVSIAAGSDMAHRPHVDLLTELALLAEVLEDDRAAFQAATSTAARLLRLDHDRGRVQPGFRADLVLLRGTELDARRVGARVCRVWKDGREILSGQSRPCPRVDPDTV